MNNLIFSVDGQTDLISKIVDYYNKDNTHETKLENVLQLGSIKIDKFADEEMSPDLQNAVRGHRVFLLCSTYSSEKIVSLALTIDAAKRASASEIVLVMPYYGYARQDRKDALRGAVGAKVMADIFTKVGADKIICVDLHAEQIQGFWDESVDTVSGHYIFSNYIKDLLDTKKVNKLTLVSPDAGGVKRVDKFFKSLCKTYDNVSFAMISKRRAKPNEIASMDLIGTVAGEDVIIIDDMVDTAGTLCTAAQLLKDNGATSVRAICTHGVLSGPAFDKINNSCLEELVISDTLPIKPNKDYSKIKIFTCAYGISKIIKAVSNSISANELTTSL